MGRAGDVLHFGVRDADGTYLDPAALLAGETPARAHLVPSGDDGSVPTAGDASAGAERRWLLGVVGERWRSLDAVTRRLAGAAAAMPDVGGHYAASALAQRLRFWAHNIAESRLATHVARIAEGVAEWWPTRDRCTPAATTPPPPRGRRIVIAVAGIGSTSERAAVDDVRTDALGYARADVIRFSYNGGRVPGAGDDRTIPVTTYDARDSQQDLFQAGRHLRELVDRVAAAHPGVPIDVIAHSQGGVVARLALEERRAVGLPPAVAHLVTLGTPHEGADLASLVRAVGQTPAGDRAIVQAQRALGLELDAHLPAGHQLAATSPVIELLRAQPPPAGVRVTSIAARGDLVVPAGRTVVRGPQVDRTTVGLVGVGAHDRLPGSAEATREIALALADRPPTCRGLGAVLADLTVSEGISWTEAVLAHTAPGP